MLILKSFIFQLTTTGSLFFEYFIYNIFVFIHLTFLLWKILNIFDSRYNKPLCTHLLASIIINPWPFFFLYSHPIPALLNYFEATFRCYIICEYFSMYIFFKKRSFLFKHKHNINNPHIPQPSITKKSSHYSYFPNRTINGFYSLFVCLNQDSGKVHT